MTYDPCPDAFILSSSSREKVDVALFQWRWSMLSRLQQLEPHLFKQFQRPARHEIPCAGSYCGMYAIGVRPIPSRFMQSPKRKILLTKRKVESNASESFESNDVTRRRGLLVLDVSWRADKFAADPDAPAIAILSYHLCYLAKSAAKTLNSRNIKGTFLPKNAVLAGFTFLHNDII